MKLIWTVAVAAGLAASVACGGRQPTQNALGRELPDAVFERGLEALKRERWTEALQILERIPLEYPGYARLQEVRLRTAEAYVGKKEYVTAAGEYTRLATDYPAGTYADDARFGACDAYRYLSPNVQRDQEYTRGAVEHCEALVAYYPASEFVPRAREIITEMTDKLAEKIYVGGEFYQKHGALDSAILYYEDLLKRYPQSGVAPRALLRLVEVYTRIRYEEEAQAARERLLREFPNSPEARALQDVPVANGA